MLLKIFCKREYFAMIYKKIERLLKPYIRDGLVYTNYYNQYGLDCASLFVGKNPSAELLKDKGISQAVFVDIFDYKFLEDYSGLRKICIIFTKKLNRAVDFMPVFNSDVNIFIINEYAAEHLLKTDLKRLAHLERISVTGDMFDREKENNNLISLELTKINNIDNLSFLSNFQNLRYLILKNGIVKRLSGLNFASKLKSMTLENINIFDCNGLSTLSHLENLSVRGIFPSDIIDEICLMEKLEFLVLDGYVEINDVEWVRNLKNLKVLILGCVIKSNDLTALQSIPYVKLKTDLPAYNLHNNHLSKEICTDCVDGIPRYDKFFEFCN